jgi:hypothetical protein
VTPIAFRPTAMTDRQESGSNRAAQKEEFALLPSPSTLWGDSAPKRGRAETDCTTVEYRADAEQLACQALALASVNRHGAA